MTRAAGHAVTRGGLLALALVAALAGAGCAKSHSNPAAPVPPVSGPVTFLTTGNPGGEDDDPAVAVDAQGVIHVVWFSDRDGTKDLYAVHSTAIDLASGIITWSTPIQITHNDPMAFPPPTQGDNFPTLLIDGSGTHHLAWHRWDLSNQCHILYAKSDGSAPGWAAATVKDVTTGANFDRFPNLVRLASDDLRIYFNSSTRGTPGRNAIFVAKSTDDGGSWGAPTEVTSLNTASEQTAFPTIVRLTSSAFIATFARWKLEPSGDALDATSDVFYAESQDATTWTVSQVTADLFDAVNDFVPSLFFDHSGVLRLAWASIGFGDPSADIVQMRVADRASYPAGVSTLSSAIGTPDHSPEVRALTVAGRQVYVMIWVRIATPPHNQVVYRVFSNL